SRSAITKARRCGAGRGALSHLRERTPQTMQQIRMGEVVRSKRLGPARRRAFAQPTLACCWRRAVGRNSEAYCAAHACRAEAWAEYAAPIRPTGYLLRATCRR